MHFQSIQVSKVKFSALLLELLLLITYWYKHCAKKPVTTMLTYPWKCTALHCNHLGNTWKPLVLMTRHFDYCPSASEGDNQSVRSSAPVVSRCFPGGYNVKLYIARGRLAWWLLAFCAVKRILFMTKRIGHHSLEYYETLMAAALHCDGREEILAKQCLKSYTTNNFKNVYSNVIIVFLIFNAIITHIHIYSLCVTACCSFYLSLFVSPFRCMTEF